MLEIELRHENGMTHARRFALPLDIGRGAENGLCLKSWRVARRHARIEQRPGGVFVEDYGGLAGTLINGHRIAQYGPLQTGDQIVIGPCLLLVERLPSAEPVVEEAAVPAPPAANARPHQPLPMPLVDIETIQSQPDAQLSHALASDTLLRHRRRLHAELLQALDLRRRDVANMSDEALRAEAIRALGLIIEADNELPPTADRQSLLLEVVNEAVGLGPLEPLLADEAVTEIMVNRHDEIFVETQGLLRRHPTVFSSDQAVVGVIERIVSPLGRRIDESSPMVDARLRDGSRVNAVIAPVALRGASLTIRKFPSRRPGMDDLLRVGTLDTAMRDFLAACVGDRKNMIISGGTGSGKTSLLNILSNCIPEGERIITIEDAAELRLDHQHLVALESRPANLEGRGRIEIRDLVRNALRMRPDRIVIGECRGSEAFDMLAAMNTGHEGSLTTLHANSPRDALSRLETMILMAGMDLPLSAVREHIAASIDIIVQQARLQGGRRVITSIVEVSGMESGRIQTQQIFRYVAKPTTAFEGCGVIPDCFVDETGQATLPLAMFDQRTEIVPGQGQWQSQVCDPALTRNET